MFWAIGIPAILLFLIVLIVLTKLTVTVEYRKAGKNDDLRIKFRAWFGMIRYTYQIPVIKANEKDLTVDVKKESKAGKADSEGKSRSDKISKNDIAASLKDFKELASHISGLHSIVRKFLKGIEITELEWHTRFGLGDAASTGSAAGILWGIKGIFCGAASGLMKLKTEPVIAVVPVFQGLCLDVVLTGMFRFRLGHAIIGGLRFVKFWKGGKPSFTSKRLSKHFGEHNNSA
ncbi:DUF2953 domain-containing protein [Bacillus mangrovi]|uniref:DUF2953 domain-containing protein n=1 Tax=Metabacillus mangrovi TaxID=1491830 RepID=A0A7X2S364_9BACI|nr:DUF2953 domain-containing protein [Metabacillus mangrovi]